jgi:opacity protein-like surface antigen
VVTPPVVNSADWSGFYAGGQFGLGRLTTEITNGEESEDIIEGDGALFGLHAGYMQDFGRLVAGAELDWDKTQIGLDPINGEGEVSSIGQIDSVARAKLRLGYDAGRFLPYATAGVARATFDYDEDAAADTAGLADNGNGSFFGLGISYMATDRFMVGIEALRHDFDDTPDIDEEAEAPFEFNSSVNTVTLRGSFRF